MSAKTKRTFKKLISYSGVFFFILAIGMLWWQLREYTFKDIVEAITSIPVWNLVAACIACFAGYLALSLYDYLALRYVGGRVTWWKWMLAGMLGFAISNNAGNAVVTGGAIRYRLYTRWRIPGTDILKMITISGLTYFLGCAAILLMGYFLIPDGLLAKSVGASVGVNVLFIVCLAALLTYFAVTIFFQRKSIKIGKIKFHVPTTKMAFLQMLLGITDSVLAGLVLYFCLIAFVPNLNFGTFIGLFVVAQATGVFSQVPGGIGVFESIFLLVLPDSVDKANIFGALLTYRIIYYVIPLLGMGGLFFIYEHYLRARMRRWIEEAKQLKEKMPKITVKNPIKKRSPKTKKK